MKKIILILCVFMATGCKKNIERTESVERPVQWCIEKCRSKLMSDLHNNNDTWGSDGNNLPFSQKDSFNTIIKHCEAIYASKCYEVNYNTIDTTTLHYDARNWK